MKTALITGKGRSGTTWLAQILNTYVHCVYKHEPFLPRKANGYSRLRQQLTDSDLTDLQASYRALARSAVHGVDLPPFPGHKSTRTQNPRVMQGLHAVGDRLSRLRFMFELYARPHMHEDADVLIKDVNFPNELLPRLCAVLEPHLIPIVRNPFANIASHLKGIELGQFARVGEADLRRIEELIALQNDPTLTAYTGRLDQLSPLQFETVRWRLQVEPLIEFANNYARARLVVYEDLCVEPMKVTQDLFDFLGWRVGPTTEAFVNISTNGARNSDSKTQSYYSVYRDPRESMNKWRDQLSTSQQAEIASVFRDSPYTHLWRDLPLASNSNQHKSA